MSELNKKKTGRTNTLGCQKNELKTTNVVKSRSGD